MKAITHRLYFSDKSWFKRYKAKRLMLECVEGATIIQAQGVWRGTREPCLVLEVITPSQDKFIFTELMSLARRLKQQLKQEAVLITRHKSQFTVIR